MAAKKKTGEPGRVGGVANESFSASVDGVDRAFHAGQTRVSAEWLDAHPSLAHLFDPMTFHFDVEQATAAPGEKRA